MNLLDQIRLAQRDAAERVVISSLNKELIVDNQHQKITGYRDLSQAEIDLMNEAKALSEQCGAFIAKLRDHTDTRLAQMQPADIVRVPTLDQRWISIGATQLQQGWMAVIRGIAQPTTF